MDTTPYDRTGVLIVRLWIERDHPTRLRARITQTHDEARGEHAVAAASSSEELCAIVKQWIDTFTHPALPTVDGH